MHPATRIRVPCPHCGDRWINAWRVTLTVGPGGASYRFLCRCGNLTVSACSPRIARLLEEAVKTVRIVPEPHVGPPLTADEVLDAVAALNDPGFFRELAP